MLTHIAWTIQEILKNEVSINLLQNPRMVIYDVKNRSQRRVLGEIQFAVRSGGTYFDNTILNVYFRDCWSQKTAPSVDSRYIRIKFIKKISVYAGNNTVQPCVLLLYRPKRIYSLYLENRAWPYNIICDDNSVWDEKKNLANPRLPGVGHKTFSCRNHKFIRTRLDETRTQKSLQTISRTLYTQYKMYHIAHSHTNSTRCRHETTTGNGFASFSSDERWQIIVLPIRKIQYVQHFFNNRRVYE